LKLERVVPLFKLPHRYAMKREVQLQRKEGVRQQFAAAQEKRGKAAICCSKGKKG